MKQESAYFEHFYPRLEPFRHFIPLKRDLSDLIEKIKWAKENDEKVAEIVKAANQLAEEETAPVKVLWSWISLLKVNFSETGLSVGNLSAKKQANGQVFLFLSFKSRQFTLDSLLKAIFHTGRQKSIRI